MVDQNGWASIITWVKEVEYIRFQKMEQGIINIDSRFKIRGNL